MESDSEATHKEALKLSSSHGYSILANDLFSQSYSLFESENVRHIERGTDGRETQKQKIM